MEKRRAKRIIAGYRTRITYGDMNYTGVIENLSESGVYVITDPLETSVDFRPEETIDLNVETPAGEQVELNCIIKWARKIAPHNVKNRLGLQIVNPPWDESGYFL